ncbi:MAG: metal-dependent hydrolase [Longimicrobiales bacterium]|nr:metal-dependent hydrolase [Longimicrobiales bacterium]
MLGGGTAAVSVAWAGSAACTHEERSLDNLTHSLVGAAIGKAGADRRTPLATATLVAAANAPDVDMLSFLGGEYYALAFRRGITHGVPALLVLPFLVAGAVLAWDRWVRRRRDPHAEPADPRWILALSAVGLATHPSLDWLNIYGMRWWLPFDGSWSYGDTLFIIDPWLWLGLGGAVFLASAPGKRGRMGWGVLALLTTLVVTLGVGGGPALLWALGMAGILVLRSRWEGRLRPVSMRWVGLVALLYIFGMHASRRGAEANVRAEAAAQGLNVRGVLVAPSRGVPFRAEVELLTEGGYVPGSHDWLATPRVRLRPDDTVRLRTRPAGMDPDQAGRIIEHARTRPRAANYLVWARMPYVHITPDDDGWQVLFGDARYDSQPEAGGLAGVRVAVPRSAIP